MIDHTDVHLLVPDPSSPDFAVDHVAHARRPAGGGRPGSTVVAAVYDLGGAEGPPATPWPAGDRDGDGVTELGRLVTAGVPNDFPRLPVHEDVSVAVWILSDRAGGDEATDAAEAAARARSLPLRTTRLMPTARSTLR
jgi:hypothetical protein